MNRKPLALLIAGLLTLGAGAAPALAAPADTPAAAVLPDIPFTRFTLPNGLTVVVSEDHKAPVVAVAVWYHVGSAREPIGKSGYAHLFEHLMFERSGHHDGNYFQPFEKVGATGMNGTTANDRTNYFETVPTTAVDMALWMESDRMGWLLDGLAQDEVNQQRGVVQNEKRQDENQPYGLRVQENIEANAYPSNHPYHHDTIGSMKDLNAASLDDFRTWFRTYYGAANATLVLVGDITPAEAKAKALKYFGEIPSGPPVAKLAPWTFPRDASTRGTMAMDVPQVHVYREWNTPHGGTEADNLLSLAATVLGGSKTSRLYQRLVYQDKLADDVSASQDTGELASQFNLEVDVKKGVDPAKVEAAVADVWKAFLEDGPTEDELQRAKTTLRAGYVRRLEDVGGFSGKATLLAASQVYQGDPGAWRKDLAAVMAATPQQVRDAARQWIGKGDYTLTVSPLAKGQQASTADVAETGGLGPAPGAPAPMPAAKHDWHTVKSDVDRSKGVPAVTSFPDLSFPTLQHARLDNGIEVTLAERHGVPLVQTELLFDAGYAADQGRKLGTSSFTMAMLDEGTKDLDSVEIAKRRQRLGSYIASGCGLDYCSITLDALADQVVPSLQLMADIARNPAFRPADTARLRGQWLAGIEQEKARPIGLALRTLPPLLYGKGHAYAIPFTGSGTEASVKALTADDMRAFMRDFVRPDNVRILVAGDTTLAKIVPELNAAFGDWKAPATPVPKKNIAKVGYPGHARVFLMDRPGSLQSVILAGEVAPSTEAPNNLEIGTMNGAFGGTFTSRLNMNLREGKHWAYGAFSFLQPAVGQRPFLIYAPVQTDQTAPSVSEALKEARAIVGPKPLTHAEIRKIKDNDVRAMPGEYQTVRAVLGAMQGIALYHRPDDYVQTLKSRIEGQDDKAVQAAADEVIKPDQLTWVIVGDLKKIGPSVRALKLGPVEVLDADGRPEGAKPAK
ncbi:pitrilysin family protein [Fulvimonas sp. R45]|uniref:M16 family metallopeptidase n=1 Tax=Fulvimonas sp. R45 TaxID=3045937 RepID=UPI00265DDDF4|nr:pitrilysin family protein [Fulvimonas sp. R45]MDO1528875.1 pitrilysin family protein [Fulvimonas sp. R45]